MKAPSGIQSDGEASDGVFHEVRAMLSPIVWADLETEARRANITVTTLARVILSEWVRGRKGETKLV